jgi:hypothetical protein
VTEITLDRDGNFSFRGVPCIRREITDVFFEKLEEDGAGGHLIRLGREVAPVQIEEAALRVFNLLPGEQGPILCLDGGLTAPFDIATARFEGDVLWCRARGLDARFTAVAALALGDFPELLARLVEKRS